MNQEVSLLAAIAALLAVMGAGYKIRKERQRLRQLVTILGEDQADFIRSLDSFATNGHLTPGAVN